jgi:hypothetical protein
MRGIPVGRALDKVDDFLIEIFARGRPFFRRAAEEFDGPFQVGTMDAIGFEPIKLIEFGAEHLKEEEFEAGAGFAGNFDKGNAQQRGGGLKGVGDIFETDLGESQGDFVEEFVEGNRVVLKAFLKIDDDAFGDVFGEPPFLVTRFFGGPFDGFLKPFLFVFGDFMGTDLEERHLCRQSDHGAVWI